MPVSFFGVCHARIFRATYSKLKTSDNAGRVTSKIRQVGNLMSKTYPGYEISNLSSGQFTDAGALASTSGWDLRFRQLDSGPHSIPFYLLHTERVTVLRIRYNRGFHHYGTSPPGMVTVGIPEEGMQDWFGRPYQDQTVLPFNQASGLDLVSQPGFTAYSISIVEEFLWSVADRCRLPVPECLSNAVSAVVIPDSRAVRNLRSALRGLFLDSQVRFRHGEEEALAVQLLLAGLGHFDIADKSASTVRAQAISKVLEFIEQNPTKVVTIGEICSATGTSWRTLDRAFLERFGIGPKAYLHRTRLSGVRDQLVASQRGELLVSDIANKWGFWHMGQFARDYRRVYEELPSETLEWTGI